MSIKGQTPNKSSFWARDLTHGYWWHISEGTGDNLTQEDIDDGYVDYIYYDYYECLDDVKDDAACDGGMILLEKLYQNMWLEEIIDKVQEFENVELEMVE